MSSTANPLHVVVGAGPVGPRPRGPSSPRRTTRSASSPAAAAGPGLPGVELRAVDATRPELLAEAARGATVLYNAANPRDYHRWSHDLAAAGRQPAEHRPGHGSRARHGRQPLPLRPGRRVDARGAARRGDVHQRPGAGPDVGRRPRRPRGRRCPGRRGAGQRLRRWRRLLPPVGGRELLGGRQDRATHRASGPATLVDRDHRHRPHPHRRCGTRPMPTAASGWCRRTRRRLSARCSTRWHPQPVCRWSALPRWAAWASGPSGW